MGIDPEVVVMFVMLAGSFALVFGVAIGLAIATYTHETPSLAKTAQYLAESRRVNAERGTPAPHDAITVRKRGVL
jgi:hypothetical protein